MARPWSEVVADPNFQALAPQAQEAARNAYFQQNVLPNIPQGANASAIRLQFDQQTVPTLKVQQAVGSPQSAGDAALGTAELVGSGIANIIPGAVNAGADLLSRVTGNGPRQQPLVSDWAHPGEAGQRVASALGKAFTPTVSDAELAASLPPGTDLQQARQALQAELAKPTAQALKESGTVLGDITGNALDVGGDVANLTGAAALAKGATGGLVRAVTSTRIVSPEVAEATGAGLKLTPEQANSGIVGRAVQSLSGSAKLERSIAKQNAPVVNNLAKTDIGIAPDQPLNSTTLKQAKAAPNAIYDRVSKLGDVPIDKQFTTDIAGIADRTGSGSFGFDVPASVEKLKTGYGRVQSFDAGDAVAKVRQLRSDAGRNLRAQDPEQNALGYAQRKVADALESQLERYVGRLAQVPGSGVAADLVDQLRGARQQLAKIHSVEDALDGSNVSAKELAKQQDRGVPLSGNLRTIANAYQNFDRSLQDVSKIRDSGPFGVLDLGYGAAAGVAHPAAASAVLARPAARAALASDLYQKFGVQGISSASPQLQQVLQAAQRASQPVISPQVAAMLAAARARAAEQQVTQ